MNVVGPVYKRTPAVEVFLVAHKGPVNHYGAQFNLSKDPVERHNMISGPSKRVLSKNSAGKAINLFEKPDWLAEAILTQYTRPGQWIYVGGFGAGGDVRGALNAGLNVVAIEKDPVQYHATIANLRRFTPDTQLDLVYTHAQMVYGHKNLALAEPEEEEEVPAPKCLDCGQVYVGAPTICITCGSAACPACIVGTPQ
jgi:hypothetical protein